MNGTAGACITQLGFSPVKGTRHLSLERIVLDGSGPVGDRRYCLVDPKTLRVLRTVQNPSLLRITVQESPEGLEVTTPQGASSRISGGIPGGPLRVDYWGRAVEVETLPGAGSELFSRYLGREVLLARAPRGTVVYGEQLTLLHESSLASLAERSGVEEETLWHRFRPTAVIGPGTRAAPAFAEESWKGRKVRVGHNGEAGVGSCRLLIGGPVPRCAVIDINPETGERDGDLLRTLAAHRPLNGRGEPSFGIFATVLRGGSLSVGDEFAF